MYRLLETRLMKRSESGFLRELKITGKATDFFSNDYLGMAQDQDFHAEVLQAIQEDPTLIGGSTGSRLISGHSQVAFETEAFLARTHQTECALLFPSGYIANLSLFSCLPQKGETVIVDEYIHRSVHDGCMMSTATKWKFKHNNLQDLEDKLKRTQGICYVAIESLYSMEGDFAPLKEITHLTEKYGASLIVDEAHAFGVFGYGLVHRLGLQNNVFATLITYGKAMGSPGAAVLCKYIVKSYLINFGSPFIYSTAPTDLTWMQLKMGYQYILNHPTLADQLQQNIQFFRSQEIPTLSAKESPIQALAVKNNEQLLQLRDVLLNKGLQTYAVFSPTVRLGQERLRICLHTFNTKEDIRLLASLIQENLSL
ncbi:pyridoxal phosphate-dependent aminotransferase family protein [Sphingobacterium faecium]|uniref:aminotransferase class I/II-fold pyridoxal phosphate-dependent enzyme n=1 Tax=Sphingobacterium faecium TaxID=34087 RepID=UPI0032096E88